MLYIFFVFNLPAATSLGAVARGKEVEKAPASLIVDDERRGTNWLTVVDTPEGYPGLLTWLLVVLDARLDDLFTDPTFVLHA